MIRGIDTEIRLTEQKQLDASSASLQRLLALDKTFDTLEQRIHEAARILGIHLAQAVPGTDSGDGTRAPLYNASRHEFALRWLLDRFRTHPDAHTCPIAWTFLRCLVQTIPPANLVKALNGLPFMPAIIDALEKTFPMDYLSPPPCPPAFDSGIPQTSKKRKRNATSQDIAPNQLATEPDNADSLSIFLDMTATLDTLVTLSKPATSSLRHNLLQSTLSMNLPDLIRFVKHWLAALLYCATPSIALGPTEWPELVTDSLNLLLQIWMLQPYSQASDKVVLSESFSRDCLWPATLLLASLRTTGSHSHHPVTESLGAIHLLERMIAQQVFVPARSAFIAKTGESDTSMQERAHISSMGLEERIQPLHSKMTALSSATNNDSATISQQAIPAMLDIAIRCTPISTPKRKIAESPWVNHLFTALTSLISEVQNPTSEGSLRPGNVILVDMLTVLRHRGLLLSKETLVNIVEDRCHLVIHGEQSRQSNHQLRNTPDFQLIATVLSMDASIFTDTGSIYSKSLLDALTLEGKVGSPSATHLSQSVFSADKEIEHTITNTVAVPLMKAFARTRNLQGFLAEWFTRLESDPTSSNHEWHIWTDFALQDAVGDVFEASLTATQISDLLELRRRPIADLALICHDPPNKRVLNGTLLPQALRQLHASSVLLKTMVGAIRSDEVLDATSTALHSLVMDIEHIFDQMPSGVDKEIDHFLLLLSQLYELWHPRWSATQTQPEMQRKATVTFSGNAVRHALQTVNSDDSSKSALHAADVAFVFICTICDMHRRVDARPPENDKTIAAVMRKAALGLRTPAIKSSKTYVTRRPGQFMAAMIRFPSLIEHVCGGESGSEVLREIIDPKSPLPSSLLTVLHGFINVIASSDYEHAKSDLFEEILKRLARLTADQHNPESAVDILLSCPIRSLSRQQRESSLNSIVDVILQSGTSLSSVVLEECLSLIVNLMESPNATAKIATNPSIVMAMAESLLKNSAMSDSNLRLFHELCTSLLRHILDTADQERSKAFIGGLSGLAAAFMNEQKEKSIQLCTGRITLLMVFFRSTEARLTTDMLTSLPHRSLSAVDSYIRRLYTQLSTCTDPHTSVLDEDSSAGSATVVTDAFVNFPATLLTCGGSSSTKCTCFRPVHHLRFSYIFADSQRIDSLLGKVLSSAETMKGVATKQQSVLPLLIKSYEQTSQRLVEESTSKLCTITEHLLARGKIAALNSTVGCADYHRP